MAKIELSLERLYGRIFLTEFGGTFFEGFFPGASFSLTKGESRPGKNAAGEMPVRKGVGKIMQNVGSRRLTSKWAKLICYPILKIQS